MNNLIVAEFVNYNQTLEQLVVNSRDIAKHFGKRHDHVIRDIENLVEKDVPKIGEMFFGDTFSDSYGRQQKCYLMNRDGFSLLVMGFTGEKALNWKIKYFEAFNILEKEYNSPEKIMARALIFADKRIKSLEVVNKEYKKQIEEAKPKMLFADCVSASGNTILVGELAKILKGNGVEVGQNRLFTWLRDNGYLIKRKGADYNMPTQRSMELGLFKIKETPIPHSDGHITISKTTKVTGKGQQYFINLFLSKGQVGA